MDGVINKVSVYDFLGIWGAGAITAFYSLATYIVLLRVDVMNYLQKLNADYSLLLNVWMKIEEHEDFV